mmetsp:Transcript_1711/g.3772  ORF Transcript_1711/g.3772 Transcript_1711/m.3772 type:complete len:246 (+) Transcript_1711:566-1303(+)
MNQVGKTIADLDVLLDLHVFGVVLVEFVRDAPLVASEDATRLKHTLDLAVDPGAIGGVAGGLNGVDGIEGVVLKGHLHEVGADELHLIGDAFLGAEGVAAVDLELVDGDGLDVGTSESGDVSGGASDAAAAIQDLRTLGDIQAAGEEVLMSQDRLVESLARSAVGEVEGSAPAPLVELGCQVIEGIDQVGVVLVASVDIGLLVIVLVVVSINSSVLVGVREAAEKNESQPQSLPSKGSDADEQEG